MQTHPVFKVFMFCFISFFFFQGEFLLREERAIDSDEEGGYGYAEPEGNRCVNIK